MRDKLVRLSEAIARIPGGSSIALGGNIMRRQPNAAVRELIRQRIGELTVYAFATGFSVDMLAAARLLRRFEGAYVGMFWHGLAPNFRRAVESGEVEVRDFPESSIVARFLAAAHGTSFMPVKAILGTDMARQDNSIVTEFACPFTGEPYAAVRAIDADFTIIHGYAADCFGNVQWPVARDADDIDQIIARGSRRLIVTVERIVSHDAVRATPNLTYIPAEWVEAVVETPFGAHPLACDTIHDEDEAHLRDYVDQCSGDAGARDYLQRYVFGAHSHDGYLAQCGGVEALTGRLAVHAEPR
ncbi:CoA transferase subunit A [Paraburkholderia sp. B3]|uniref:CoA transferase subunit A n=1 Tax=Paraburkholderia sp. B3 TaxID=3134791 RepID=UPI003981E518